MISIIVKFIVFEVVVAQGHRIVTAIATAVGSIPTSGMKYLIFSFSYFSHSTAMSGKFGVKWGTTVLTLEFYPAMAYIVKLKKPQKLY